MAGRTVTRIKKLSQLFPTGDPLACKVFQLCVLRDDLFLELIGVSEDKIASLDRADGGVRRLYFFRRSALTLNEVATAVNSSEYSQLATDDPADGLETCKLKEAARDARNQLNKARDRLNYARNRASGHVDYDKVSDVLRHYGHFRGPVDLGDPPAKTMYRIASQAMFLAMIDAPGGATGSWEPKFEALVKEASETTLVVIEAIDCLVGVYLRTTGRWGS